MKTLGAMLLLLGCWGCSGGVHSRLLTMDVQLSSPLLNEDRLPIFSPGGAVGSDKTGAADLSMVQAYGSSWRNQEGEYPGYTFNR